MVAAMALGQYSVVSYVHSLRGEKVNLGVLVWHPVRGAQARITWDLQRVRCIDEGVDLERVRTDLKSINDVLTGWDQEEQSPLTYPTSAFRHGLMVSKPMNARIQDSAFTAERLYSSLVAPAAPYARASTTTQFTNSFVAILKQILSGSSIGHPRFNYTEEETFQPVRVAASYAVRTDFYIWRTTSFASLDTTDRQLTAAKAFHAENADLMGLDKYQAAKLGLVVQMPKPSAQADFAKALDWLYRDTKRVELVVDQHSLEQKMPSLVLVSGAK